MCIPLITIAMTRSCRNKQDSYISNHNKFYIDNQIYNCKVTNTYIYITNISTFYIYFTRKTHWNSNIKCK